MQDRRPAPGARLPTVGVRIRLSSVCWVLTPFLSSLKGLHDTVWWCTTCLSEEYADDFARFKERLDFERCDELFETCRSDEEFEDAWMRGAVENRPWYERERLEAEIMQQTLDQWHGNCVPGDGILAADFTYSHELLTEEGACNCFHDALALTFASQSGCSTSRFSSVTAKGDGRIDLRTKRSPRFALVSRSSCSS